MNKVNQLFQDEQEILMVQYLYDHPNATEEEAFEAINRCRDEPIFSKDVAWDSRDRRHTEDALGFVADTPISEWRKP